MREQLLATRRGLQNRLFNSKIIARGNAVQPVIQSVLAAWSTFCDRRTPSQRTESIFDQVTVVATTYKLPSAFVFASDRCQITAWNEQRSELIFKITPALAIDRHRSLCETLREIAAKPGRVPG